MSIQQNIASDYYAMANHAQTPEQINAVRQHIAQTIQNGGLEAYKGIPILNELNGKLTALQSADQMKAGLLPQKPPIAQQVLSQATQPQQAPQPMQPEPMPTESRSSGVDELPSRLPTEMAEGGIIGYAGGGDVKHFQVGGLGIADLLSGFSPEDLGALDQERNINAGRNVSSAGGRYSIPDINKMSSMPRTIPQIPNLSNVNIGNTPTPAQQSLLSKFANFWKSPSYAGAGEGIASLGKNVVGPVASAPGAVVGAGGSALSTLAARNMANNPALMEAYSNYGDPGSDTSLAASILSSTKDNPTTDSAKTAAQTTTKKEEKEIKKIADKPIANIKKAVADKIVKEPSEVGPPKDLMNAEPTTPKEDALSKYEQMLTQSPEARQKEKDLDFYTRLFQAGIGVASGSSRNALENLKEAQPAIAGFASDIAKQREEDRSRIKDLAALGLKREEFGMELKKLGLTEKQIDSVSKHYADWNRHMQAQEGIETKKLGLMAGANQDMKILAQVDNNFKALLANEQKILSTNPTYVPRSEMELHQIAQQMVGNTIGRTVGSGGSVTPQKTPAYDPVTRKWG
jgi:hypothetical protein